MRDIKDKLLIVDDERSIRLSMSGVLAENGYRVRTAADGVSALVEIGKEAPDILVTDLNMPGMSGFELLSVVRHRFTAIRTIAMSCSFTGQEVPSGVAADAFYEKGSSFGALLRIMENLPCYERMPAGLAIDLAPLWIQPRGQDDAVETKRAFCCPECRCAISEMLNEMAPPMRRAVCAQCGSRIGRASLPKASKESHPSLQPGQAFRLPAH